MGRNAAPVARVELDGGGLALVFATQAQAAQALAGGWSYRYSHERRRYEAQGIRALLPDERRQCGYPVRSVYADAVGPVG